MDLRDAALQYCERVKDRLIIFPPDLPISADEITRGIIFVWATWSVPARQALEALAASLSSHTDFEKIPLYIADNDAANTERFMATVGQRRNGAGETFWIDDGAIAADLNNYSGKDWTVLVENNRRLLPPK